MVQLSKRAAKLYEIIEKFVEGRLAAKEFERAFLDEFKSPTVPGTETEEEYPLLNDMFFAVDDYCEDSELRGEEDLDADELKERARMVLTRLEQLKASA